MVCVCFFVGHVRTSPVFAENGKEKIVLYKAEEKTGAAQPEAEGDAEEKAEEEITVTLKEIASLSGESIKNVSEYAFFMSGERGI